MHCVFVVFLSVLAI